MPKYPGYKWVGTAYVRGEFHREIPSTGAELCSFAKMIPMFCVPTYYWFSGKIISSAVGVAPDAAAWLHQRFGIGNMNLSQEAVETDDFNGDEMMDRYMDIGSGAFSGDDGDTETDLGLPGDTELSSRRQRKRDFYGDTVQLGLPDKAVFSDANQITYVHQFSISGKPPETEFSLPKFVLGGTTVDIAGTNTDWSDAILGQANGVNDLYRSLLESFSEIDEITGVTGRIAALGLWASQGFRDTNVVDVDALMHARIRGTIQVQVYAMVPGSANVITIPR